MKESKKNTGRVIAVILAIVILAVAIFLIVWFTTHTSASETLSTESGTEDTNSDDSNIDASGSNDDSGSDDVKTVVETRTITIYDVAKLADAMTTMADYNGSYYGIAEVVTTDELTSKTATSYSFYDYDKDSGTFEQSEIYRSDDADYINTLCILYVEDTGLTASYGDYVDNLDNSNSYKTSYGNSLEIYYYSLTDGYVGSCFSITSDTSLATIADMETFMKRYLHFTDLDEMAAIKNTMYTGGSDTLQVADTTYSLIYNYDYAAEFEVQGYTVTLTSSTKIQLENGFITKRTTEDELVITDSNDSVVYDTTYSATVSMSYVSDTSLFPTDFSDYAVEEEEPADQDDPDDGEGTEQTAND